MLYRFSFDLCSCCDSGEKNKKKSQIVHLGTFITKFKNDKTIQNKKENEKKKTKFYFHRSESNQVPDVRGQTFSNNNCE